MSYILYMNHPVDNWRINQKNCIIPVVKFMFFCWTALSPFSISYLTVKLARLLGCTKGAVVRFGRAGGLREWCSAPLPDELHDASAANFDQQ